MRKTYHLCISSHDEVLYRDKDDYNYAFNCFAYAVMETEARALGEGFMSTHRHAAVQAEDYKDLIHIERYAYSRYFNTKYHRKGRLGEKQAFALNVEGYKHIQTMLSYVFRQALHHGISNTPFGYEHNSVNCIFRRELGKEFTPELLKDREKGSHLPSNIDPRYFSNIRMRKDGVLLREDVIDTAYVEELFVTARSFLYCMNRLSGQKWRDEQLEDSIGGKPIELGDLEPGFQISDILSNEKGRADDRKFNDTELCDLIDSQYLKRYFRDGADEQSIYLLPYSKRCDIGNDIWHKYRFNVTKEQIFRCAAIGYTTK